MDSVKFLPHTCMLSFCHSNTYEIVLQLQITKRIEDDGGDVGTTDNWNWRSSGDLFLNGAYFTNSGASSTNADFYAKATSFSAHPVDMVASMTADAGPLKL